MPRRIPTYRCFKPKNLGLVVIDGHQHYLGSYGTPESMAEYNRLIQLYLAKRPGGGRSGSDLSVNEVILAFWDRHVDHYRRADGTPTGELGNFRDSLRPLRKLFGSTPAPDFGAIKLKTVRQAMIDAGLARTTINQRVGRIVHVFKWAASEELVPVTTYQLLKTVAGLQQGRTNARETEPIRPVSDEMVDAIRTHVAPQVWAMVELQRLTGARPGEVVIMRTCDVDRSGDVWCYMPSRHKTMHRGKSRRIPIGPRAQEVLRPWLRSDLGEYLFSPREAMAEFRAGQRRQRRTPLYASRGDRKAKEDPKRTLGDRYTTTTYHHAVGTAAARPDSSPGTRTS